MSTTIKKLGIIIISCLFGCVSGLDAGVILQAVHSASNDVLVAFFTGDSTAIDDIDIGDTSLWKINGKPASEIFLRSSNPFLAIYCAEP